MLDRPTKKAVAEYSEWALASVPTLAAQGRDKVEEIVIAAFRKIRGTLVFLNVLTYPVVIFLSYRIPRDLRGDDLGRWEGVVIVAVVFTIVSLAMSLVNKELWKRKIRELASEKYG